MKSRYSSPAIVVIELSPEILQASGGYTTVTSVPTSEVLDGASTTVINGGIIGSEVTDRTFYGDGKSSVWDLED